jgi:anti-sigma-K factor RskA
MNCEEATELLPAYVLGALEPDEVAEVESHLAGCRRHDQELVELRATVFAIDRYREELAPTPSLALAGRLGEITPEVVPATASPAGPATEPASRRGGGLTAGWRGVAALAAVLLVFGAGWLAASMLGGAGDTVYAVVLQGDAGSTMEVSGATGEATVMVVMDGIERLPDGSSYQVWAIREQGWVPIGTCNTNAEGWWHGEFDFQIREGEEVALTVEPAGGSDAPSGEPILRSAP